MPSCSKVFESNTELLSPVTLLGKLRKAGEGTAAPTGKGGGLGPKQWVLPGASSTSAHTDLCKSITCTLQVPTYGSKIKVLLTWLHLHYLQLLSLFKR